MSRQQTPTAAAASGVSGLGSTASLAHIDSAFANNGIFAGNSSLGNDSNNDVQKVPTKSPRMLYLGWVHMAIGFAMTISTIISTLGLSVGVFGPKIGGYGTAALYGGMGMSLLLGFPAFVINKVGGKNGLIFALSAYCTYPLAYFIAALVENEDVALPIVIVSAIGGGFCAGCLWVAYGAYLNEVASALTLAINSRNNNINSSNSSNNNR